MNDEMISWEECIEMFIKEITYHFPNANFFREGKYKSIKIIVDNYATEWHFLDKEKLYLMYDGLIVELCNIEKETS